MKNSRKRRRRIWLKALLLVICLYSAVRLVGYVFNSISVRQTNRELQQMFGAGKDAPETSVPAPESAPTASPAPEPKLLDSYQYFGDAPLSKAQEMLDKNPDTVAWLHIPDGVVNLPVVYRDNTYYLDHDFYGRQSKNGTLFLDENHPFLPDTQYMVIHGHNWYDGSMFGKLANYRKEGYMQEHSTVYLYTLYRKEEYEVIGVLVVPGDVWSEDYVPYTGVRKFRSEDQFFGFVGILQGTARYWKSGVQMQPNEAYLALSTCLEDDRIVVICRRTNPQ